MSEVKDAGVDRLTRHEIEEYLGMLDGADMILDVEQSFMKRLCDLALQSLSQEAVREALENLVSLLLQTMEPIGPMRSRGDYPPELQTAINALKREPNAAAQVDGLARRWVDHPDRPAPAAPDVGGCHVCAGPALKFGTGCTLPNCPYSVANLRELLRESLPYVAMKLSTQDLIERIEFALSVAEASKEAK